MKKVLLAIFAAITLSGCSSSNPAPMDNEFYRVTKYVGDTPVERWVCRDITARQYGGVTVFYKGNIINAGENVKWEVLSGHQKETYEILLKK